MLSNEHTYSCKISTSGTNDSREKYQETCTNILVYLTSLHAKTQKKWQMEQFLLNGQKLIYLRKWHSTQRSILFNVFINYMDDEL